VARTSGYVIPDEPAPGKLAAITVTPYAAFLGFVLGGAVVGLPWMVLNGFAIGSATRKREAAIAVATLAGMLALALFIGWLHGEGFVPDASLRYLGLSIHATRLVGGYTIFLMQERSFELYQHFGGQVTRHGWVIAVALMVIRIVLVVSLDIGWLETALLF